MICNPTLRKCGKKSIELSTFSKKNAYWLKTVVSFTGEKVDASVNSTPSNETKKENLKAFGNVCDRTIRRRTKDTRANHSPEELIYPASI